MFNKFVHTFKKIDIYQALNYEFETPISDNNKIREKKKVSENVIPIRI